ncbi:uncharacterized protein LOC113540012 [Pangasianodon hypophthalmus]|uniref:uncharacterized protein LOC113540012 n=1 Tax=Pangasianodon hypophthalmus TaxID=310915 RepID=UPI000F00A0A0|nr:uncharacterized protein LOC113540012 [Pangasianodon hypophthalmus]
MFIGIYAVLFSLVTEAVLGLTLEQKDLSMTKEEGKTVYISCNVTGLSSSDYVHWYQKKEGEGLTRILYIKSGSQESVPDADNLEAKNFGVRVQSDNYDLKIVNLKKSHSAVYYCAAWDSTHSDSKYTKTMMNLANVDGEAQPAAAQMSVMDTALDHVQDEATPRVEWALTPMGLWRPREEYASAIASTTHREILCFVTGDPLVRPPKHKKGCSGTVGGPGRIKPPGTPQETNN